MKLSENIVLISTFKNIPRKPKNIKDLRQLKDKLMTQSYKFQIFSMIFVQFYDQRKMPVILTRKLKIQRNQLRWQQIVFIQTE
jgi:hypothetical protein